MWDRLFLQHPRSVGETYLQHLHMATRFGLHMIRAGAGCMVHGLLPFLFVRTGSRTVEELYRSLVTNRARKGIAQSSTDRLNSADGTFDYVI